MARDGHAGRYGHDEAANALSYRITRAVAAQVAERPLPYCEGFGGRACCTRSRASTATSASRPAPASRSAASPASTSTCARWRRTTRCSPPASPTSCTSTRPPTRNPEAVVDVIRGAFAEGMRDVTFNLDSNDFIRITGYLVRKSDLARIDEGARHGSTFLGAGSEAEAHCTQRATKRVVAARAARGGGAARRRVTHGFARQQPERGHGARRQRRPWRHPRPGLGHDPLLVGRRPGNRFVAFLQGCDFDCIACHNPYTIHVCHHCGECVEACASGALTFDGAEVRWNAAACTGGDACVRACRFDSTPKARCALGRRARRWCAVRRRSSPA
jgi:ferredoxin